MRIEIEDTNGNTVGSFRIHNIGEKDIQELKGFSVADLDSDYIGNTESISMSGQEMDAIVDDIAYRDLLNFSLKIM